MKSLLVLLAIAVGAASAKSINLGTFSYQTCNAAAPIQISDLSVTPDPLVLPGTASVSLTGTNGSPIYAPTALSVTLQKSVNGIWINVPCLGQMGSCDFSDICAELDYIFPNGEGCPQPIIDSGLGCSCPIAAGTYSVANLAVDMTSNPPAEITDGDYHLGISVSTVDTQLSCVDVYLSVVVSA